MWRNRPSEWLWLPLVAVVLAGIFIYDAFFKKRNNDMDEKKRITNIIGVCVLGTLVLAIGSGIAIKYINQQTQIAETKRVATHLAKRFAEGEAIAALEWAKGDWKDAWDQSLILIVNSSVDGAQFGSIGPDGESGTEDDFTGDVQPWTWKKKAETEFEKKRELVIKAVEEKAEEAEEDTHGIYDGIKDKWKGFWDKGDSDE